MKLWIPRRDFWFKTMLLVLPMVGLSPSSGFAKEPSLTAIELYDGTAGAAYIQLANVTFNGKAELRDCRGAGTGPIDKSAYNKLDKLTIAPGGVLERGGDGVLRYSSGGEAATCVVPTNVKFEHGGPLTPSAMAEGMTLTAAPIGTSSDSTTGTPHIKSGVKLVFIDAPNKELAEYLLADRMASVAGWESYLAKHSGSAGVEELKHVTTAKDSLAALYGAAGEKALSDYQKASASGTPAYKFLTAAKVQADLAHKLLPLSKAYQDLAAAIHIRLQALTDQGLKELDAYKSALETVAPGFGHLEAANALAQGVAGVDPTFAPGSELLNEVIKAKNDLDSALRSAAAAADQQQMDDALKFVLPYRGFAKEDPRIGLLIENTYKFHMARGKQAGDGQNWETAVDEYRKAKDTKDTSDAQDALKDAQEKLVVAKNNKAAQTALDKSQAFESQKDLIDAYEALASLTAQQQRSLNVSDEMARLAPGYVKAAFDKAKNIIQKGGYIPIQGMDDERHVEQAYALLQKAEDVSDDDATKQSCETQQELAADSLSAWFLKRARKYLEKPAGSFTEVGWAYLKEAESYKGSNLDQVRDAITQAGPAHEMHSKLSIRVQVLDQASGRESTGRVFLSLLEDAIVAKLQEHQHFVKPIKSGEQESGGDPDFDLDASVLEHEITPSEATVSKESEYRAGTQPEPNPDWYKANRELQDAKNQEQADNRDFTTAQLSKNKSKIQELAQKLSDDQKHITELEEKRDLYPQSLQKDILKPYQYRQETIDIANKIKVQFSISRAQRGQVVAPVKVEEEQPAHYVETLDVKPDDTRGIKQNEITPNLPALQTALEDTVRDELKAAVESKLVELPTSIYKEAQAREQENPEDAGEAYMRYLSVTLADETPERKHAESFLHDNFNFPPPFPSRAP